ncbi:hypothetical protein BDV34DRAFT_185122, partial [Aspergillus parasiticus]
MPLIEAIEGSIFSSSLSVWQVPVERRWETIRACFSVLVSLGGYFLISLMLFD